MSTGILVMGPSGSGKSTSMRNLDPKETYIINVQGKKLPFRGGRKMYSVEEKNIVSVNSPEKVLAYIRNVANNAEHIKTLVVDDFQYVMVSRSMEEAEVKGYDKFTLLAKSIWNILNEMNSYRDDLNIIFLAHTEFDQFGVEKIKTIGRALDSQVNIEGMFTIVLKTSTVNGEYKFHTQTNGSDTVKSPMGMFEELTIDNDLKLVVDAINEY